MCFVWVWKRELRICCFNSRAWAESQGQCPLHCCWGTSRSERSPSFAAQIHLPTRDLSWANLKVQLHLSPLDFLIFWSRLEPCIGLFCCWSILYSSILRTRPDWLRSQVILPEWIAFYSAFLNIHRSGVLTALAKLVLHGTLAISAISAYSVYTIQPCTMPLHTKPYT